MNFVQEQSGGSSTANLLTGLGLDETFARTDVGGTSTLLTDALGSTLALADRSGAVQTQYTFDPFGATTASGATSTNAGQFTGRENDSTGLDFYRARFYSPGLQRFISEDPLGPAGGLNRATYANNNPATLIDPLGLKPKPGFGKGKRGAGSGGDGADDGSGDSAKDGDPPRCGAGTAQVGLNGSGNFGGVSVSAFAGVVIDSGGNAGAYWGEGIGLGAGAGASLAGQAGFSNGRGISSIGGPFVDIGGGGGAGAIGGADYFGGMTNGEMVQGGYASAGIGVGGSASAQVTNTTVVPF